MRKLANEELGRKSIEEFKHADKKGIVVVLDNIRSLNNVGSAFRTADSFLVDSMYLCGVTGTPPNNEIHKTALGATETVEWKYRSNTLEAIIELKKLGYIICSVEQAENATMLNNWMPEREKKYALIFGNEVYGVEQEVVDAGDMVIEIPQDGTKHSLNVAVSIGIVVWHIIKERI